MVACLIQALVLLAGRGFYPCVTLVGELPDGALLLAANHPNGLLDGLALLLATDRQITFLAKSTFFASPLLAPLLRAFGAVPVYRPTDRGQRGGPMQQDANRATFANARMLLRSGGQLAIFPEGTPNPQPTLLPLKTGTARIALETEQEAGWSLGLRIMPIGLWFQNQAQPRTAVLAHIGMPITVSEWRDAYSKHPQATVLALTEELRIRLTSAVAAAELAGPASVQHAAHRGEAHTRSKLVHLVAAPCALLGYLLALPGIAIGHAAYWALTRRHRGSLGTARLVALAAGLVLGWFLAGLVVAWLVGVLAGAAMLGAGPLLGYGTLRWMDADAIIRAEKRS